VKELIAAKVDSYYNSKERGQRQIVEDVLSSLESERRRFLKIAEWNEKGTGRPSWRDPNDDEKRRHIDAAFLATRGVRRQQNWMGKDAFGEKKQPPRKKRRTV